MEPVSFFDEQTHRKRQTFFFVMLGLLWMVIMGWLVVMVNAPLLALMEVDDTRIREWSVISSLAAVGIWGLLALVLLFCSGRFLPFLIGAKQAAGVDENALQHAVECMPIAAMEAGSTPRWYVLETDAMNAFASGQSLQDGSVTVTRGLLNRLNEEELQAVVAHEIAHLKNGDTQFIAAALAFAWMVLGTGIAAGVLTFLAAAAMFLAFMLVTQLFAAIAEDEIGGLIAIGMMLGAFCMLIYGLFLLAAYLLALAVVFAILLTGVKAASSAISQSREYLADACAVQWTRNAMAMASALRKVSGGPAVGGLGSSMVAPLWLSDARAALSNGFLDFLMRTHPDVEQRLERIGKMAGSQAFTDGRWLLDVRPTWQARLGEWLWPLGSTSLAILLSLLLASHMLYEAPTGSQTSETDVIDDNTTTVGPRDLMESEGLPTAGFPPGQSASRAMPGERFPDTRLRWLGAGDIQHLSRDDLQYAINEMFARHGADFGNRELKRQFQQYTWYRPIAGVTFDEIETYVFSNMEKANLLILAGERQRRAVQK